MKKQILFLPILFLPILFLFSLGLSAQPRTVGEPQKVAQMSQPLQTPVWSPDGAKLFFTSMHNKGLWEVSVNGAKLSQISAQDGAGKWLPSLTTIRMNPLVQQMLDEPAEVAEAVEALNPLKGRILFNPALSPQGDKIVFQALGEGLFLCNADGSGLQSLGKGERAAWTPDGKYLVVMEIEDDGEVVTKSRLTSILVASGLRYTLFASDKHIPLSPAVSPDGKKLAFEDYGDGAIYVMDIE
jgi:Tol biopolymer transport system component